MIEYLIVDRKDCEFQELLINRLETNNIEELMDSILTEKTVFQQYYEMGTGITLCRGLIWQFEDEEFIDAPKLTMSGWMTGSDIVWVFQVDKETAMVERNRQQNKLWMDAFQKYPSAIKKRSRKK